MNLLAAEPRIDAHHQDIIGQPEHLFDGGHGRRRIDDHAGARARPLDLAQGAVEMLARFLMHAHLVGARFNEDRARTCPDR
jgi:hypothetical protein